MKILSPLIIISLLFTQSRTFPNDINISANEYKERRAALKSELPAHPVLFVGNSNRNRINDTDYEFRQESNFLYFSGFNEADAYMIISKKPFNYKGKLINELIFVKENNLQYLTWSGKRLGTRGVKEQLGFENVADFKEFEPFMKDFVKQYQEIHLNTPIFHTKTFADKGHKSYKEAFAKDMKLKLDPVINKNLELKKGDNNKTLTLSDKEGLKYRDGQELNSVIAKLRGVKSEREVEMIQRAVDISIKGHLESMKISKDVNHEYQVEAAIEYAFKYHGAEDVGYNSIVGCGQNATILHYNTNRDKFRFGDIFCLDAGAEFHGYTADITRSFPSDGTFSEAQKEIYEIVLAAQSAGAEQLRVGSNYNKVNYAITMVVAKGLKGLGIVNFEKKKYTKNDLIKSLEKGAWFITFSDIVDPDGNSLMQKSILNRFYAKGLKKMNFEEIEVAEISQVREVYPHGWGHHVGLDVHDPGQYTDFKENMVWTIEPGIYISNRISYEIDPKYMNIGIRIEDVYKIAKDGAICMSEALPKDIEEIEELMEEDSKLLLD